MIVRSQNGKYLASGSSDNIVVHRLDTYEMLTSKVEGIIYKFG